MNLPPRQDGGQHRLVLCCPTITKPHDAFLRALEAEVPHLNRAELDHRTVFEIGCPYISHARASMLRKAMSWDADIIVFLDHDMSWKPGDLARLIATDGDVVAGTYRFKQEAEEYMGTLRTDEAERPITRKDGCIRAEWVPAGFLKITSFCVHKVMGAYPELVYGPRYNPSVDLFNHGAHNGLWYGEDYAFSRRWNDCGGEIWLVPDLDLTHHNFDGGAFPGNFHQYLRRQPGGDMHEQEGV